jgi:cell wall-associated NlpC family hydrolase
LLPRYYSSLASLQLVQQKSWRESHESIIDSSFNYLTQLGQTKKGTRLRINHSQELLAISLVLNDWMAEQTVAKEKSIVIEYQKKVKDLAYSIVKIQADEGTTVWEAPVDSKGLEWAISLIQYAQSFLGTTYLWGGQSPEGFDCSGFTSYVFLNQGKRIPRVSRDQFAQSTQISSNEAHLGDLVFFGTNGVVSHVGILVNAPGQPKQMIHSSSSKGVVFQEIDNSKYYSSRIIGFGRY